MDLVSCRTAHVEGRVEMSALLSTLGLILGCAVVVAACFILGGEG
jgi:hypothetical protein